MSTVTVAGHYFHIHLPDGHPLRAQMGNYEPFLEDGAPAFSLSFQPDSAAFEDQGTHIRTLEGGYIGISLAPDDSSPAVARLRLSPDYACAQVQIHREWERHLPACKFALDTAAMIQFAFFTAANQTLLLHASAVVFQGKAYAFLGKSGTGKSTHSRLWLEHIPGTELLNDDNPVLRIFPDGGPVLFGSPWSGKTPCYKNESAPLGALVRLHQHPQNRIARLEPLDAFLQVSPSVSAFHLRGGAGIKQKLHDTLAVGVQSVPVFELFCKPDREAALLCRDVCAG